MKRLLTLLLPAFIVFSLVAVETPTAGQAPAASTAASEIDWEKAKNLHGRAQRGEKLSAEEQAYLDKAIAARQPGRPGAANGGRPASQRTAPEHLAPLCDMSAQDRYEGEDGGLYGRGRNTPPEELLRQAQAETARIQPLDAEGHPADDGKIAFISISMSNATQEFSTFKRLADASPQKSRKVEIVDCAQGGQAMAEWAPPNARPWEEAKARLARAGVALPQVQVAWIKLANKGPQGTLAEHGHKLERDTQAVLQNAHALFPNLRIAYLGSRIWAGNATSGLNPEPYAYEGAFVVRWLIQRQMKGDAELTDGKAPLLLWGPYLWAEGTKGRQSDGLVWQKEDFGSDGTHPSESGREKVAKLLLGFLSTDRLAKQWFVGAQP